MKEVFFDKFCKQKQTQVVFEDGWEMSEVTKSDTDFF